MTLVDNSNVDVEYLLKFFYTSLWDTGPVANKFYSNLEMIDGKCQGRLTSGLDIGKIVRWKANTRSFPCYIRILCRSREALYENSRRKRLACVCKNLIASGKLTTQACITNMTSQYA